MLNRLKSAAAALGMLALGQPAYAQTEVSVAVVPCSCFAPYFIAQEKGYFDEKGVSVKPIQVTSGQDAISLVATGQIDMLFGAISAGFFNALSRGIDVRIVASMGGESLQGEAPAVPLLVRSELVDSGEVKGLADLKGRRVGIGGGMGSISSYDLSIYMNTVGLGIDNIDVVNVPSTELLAALGNGSVDAGIASSPFSTRIVQEGAGKMITGSIAKLLGRDLFKTAVIVSPDFFERKPKAAQAVVDALYRANADLRGDGYAKPENLAIVGAATKLEGDALTRDRFHFNDELDPAAVDLKSLQDAFVAMGVVTKPADVSNIITRDLIERAKAGN